MIGIVSTPLATAMAPDEADIVAQPQLSTIAGSGYRGRLDGAANLASFLTPAGVAIASDGTIYVSDVGSQTIRRLKNGRVDTFAGVADPGNSAEIRVGGFQDGVLAQARFDRPIALAAHDDTLYVVDAGNYRIREIANGVVGTLVGDGRAAATDGRGTHASLLNPKGIAVADDETLYVADDGAGIRKIDRTSRITTLPLPSDHKHVLGIAVRTIGGKTYLAYTDASRVYLTTAGNDAPQSLAYDDARDPYGAGVNAGHAYGVAILNENTVVVSDVARHAVRLIRFATPPYVDSAVVRDLAGGTIADDVTGAFADGPPGRSRLDTPTAIALANDGSLVIADAGNRRIRRLANIDARESVLPDLSNLAPANGSTYRVAVVGNSYAFYNVLWPESIGGRVESALSHDGQTIGLHQKPSVTTFRTDSAGAQAELSLIHEYFLDTRTNLIVLLLNDYTPIEADDLIKLRSELDAHDIDLLLVYTPQGFAVSPRAFWDGHRDEGETIFVRLRDAAAKQESYYSGTGLRGLYLLEAMESQSGIRNAPPLFYASDHHFTVYGSQWVGRRIAEAIETWRPWLRKARAQ